MSRGQPGLGLHVGLGGGPMVVVSTAAFHARVRGWVPGLGGLEETKNVSTPSTCESIVGRLRDRDSDSDSDLTFICHTHIHVKHNIESKQQKNHKNINICTTGDIH